MKPLLSFSLGAIAALSFTGCGETVDMTGRRSKTEYLGQMPRNTGGNPGIDTVSYWDGDGVQGPPKIHIDLSDQKAYYYKGSELVGVSMISTGREGFDTPTGDFSIIQKNPDHRSNLYGEWIDENDNVIDNDVDVRKKPTPPPGVKFLGASMPHFMRIKGGVGMHAGFLPGFAASHGCIRMPAHMAERYFNESPYGTPVSVSR
ncbi:MAG: lipoprotein-anchoring transpeptidase ErfK/SrfK [Verrucomicrobiales bacterium]